MAFKASRPALAVSLSGAGILATSYFRATYRSTIIGAAAFHFRVRNGNGWFHCAMVTRGPGWVGLHPGVSGGLSWANEEGLDY